MKNPSKIVLHLVSALRSIFPTRRFRPFAALLGFALLVCALSSKAETVQLYDHATSPCYLYSNEGRADWTIVHITVVTGTVWMHDNDYYFDVRLRDASGNRIGLGSAGSMYIPQGTPAGTVVSEFDTQINYPLCENLANPMVYGFPRQVYEGGTEQTIGTASGSGLIIPYQVLGDGGYTGSGLGALKPAGAQIWTVYDNLALPTRGPNTTCDAPKIGGNAPSCASCGSSSNPRSSPPPMAQYSVHSALVSLNIQDRPLRYSPAYGPSVDFTVTYNQNETQQPATFTYSNMGPKWTFGWLSYVSDDPNSQLPLTGVYRSGGGAEIFAYDNASQSFVKSPRTHASLVKTSAASYERRLPDGSKEVFAQSNGATSYPRRIFMTQIVDPAGNTLNIGYDASFRVTTITDALSQVTTVSYELPADPLKVTKVTDPFGRFASFEYTNGQLTKITDEIGIQSQFTYTPGTDSIDSLTTPYGTTTFVSGQNGTNRWIEATDPLGGKERVEYRDHAPGISATDPVAPTATGITNAGLDMANTFYWDKKAMMVAPGDYTQAKIIHWLYNADGTVADTVSSEKLPLENRVWYTYAGQPDYQHVGSSANPSQIARVLADGSTQLNQFEYNTLGKTTKTTDPVGRVMSYVYDANNIDLLEIRQTRGTNNELQRKFTYNTLHEPLTDTDAAGQVTTFTYNTQGQPLTRKNAKNETTTYAYGGTVPAGLLASITSPPFNSVSAVTSFTYDSFKRVRTVTDSDNYTITTDYDNLDRKIKVTYPDTTFEEFKYTDNVTGAMTLDVTGTRDRRGLWTYRHYNANQKMDSITDPANRTTQYGWCTCGALTSITDPRNQTTTFYRDIQGRVYQKVFQDGTTIDYLYEGQTAPNTAGATSRLKSSTDAKSQRTNYSYFADDNIQQISYTSLAGQPLTPPTASVNYTYDPNYNRVSTMVDGTGTTTYGYNSIAVPPTIGAGRLATIDGPLLNDTVAFSYDELGRELSEGVNGANRSQTYDVLGRVGTVTNPVGVFTNVYDGVTARLQSMSNGSGQTTTYSYYPNSGDHRLQTLTNLAANGSILSKFDYAYDPAGQITFLQKQLGPTGYPTTWTGAGGGSMYDAADQLTSVVEHSADDVYSQSNYGYDLAGNRTEDNGGSHFFNSANQPIYEAYRHDANGNLTQDAGRTYEWDAANRLIAITYPVIGGRTEFTYNGTGHRVKTVEYQQNTPVWTSQFQPPDANYTFYSADLTLPAGTYTFELRGLDLNNTVLLDNLMQNGAQMGNGGFESPVQATGAYMNRPGGTSWMFTGESGVANRYAVDNPAPPEGTQMGFIQNMGSIWQVLTFATSSNTLSATAAQWVSGNTSAQRVRANIYAGSSPWSVAKVQQFIWIGERLAEERDGNNVLTRRYFPEGEQQIGVGDGYYTRDHLGSIREVIGTQGSYALAVRYDYDAWGNRRKVEGAYDVDWGFTGHYYHANSGLYLAPYRAYDPTLGRWLSRDPIEEKGGLNLYHYAFNDPNNLVDRLGLDVKNDSAEWVAVVPEDNLDGTVLLAPGETYKGRQEGFYVAESTGLCPRNYYKTVDGVDATYSGNGKADYHSHNPLQWGAQVATGGWTNNPFADYPKVKDKQNEVNAKEKVRINNQHP